MANYRIFETEAFQHDLAHLTRSGLKKLERKLEEHVYPLLRKEPHFGPNIKRLKNWTPATWRYRIGSWRFFYEVNEKKRIIFKTAADHRSSAYRS